MYSERNIYCISDIHGAYTKFKAMLKKIKFNKDDILYILGDVVDRGAEPIPLLMDIMERENVVLLLGNHEKMMYESLINEDDCYAQNLWFANGGEVTYSQFIQLSDWDKNNMLDYIYHLPVIIPNLVIGGQTYYLGHASCIDLNYQTEQTIDSLGGLNSKKLERALWTREINPNNIINNENRDKYRNVSLIAGHTSTFKLYTKEAKDVPGHIYKGHKGHYINIDCGCSIRKRNGRLGCLRLNDKKEFYV